MATFVEGRELSRRFALEVVEPIVRRLTGEPIALALLGPGSDVLGFDDVTSMDHGWGPRVQLFASNLDEDALRARLPQEFLGFPLSMAEPWHSAVSVWSVDQFLSHTLGGINVDPEDPLSYLLVTQQELLSVTQPNIWLDELGLEARIHPFRAFPIDVKRYLLASLWSRIGEEEHLVGRAGMTGDDLGARLIVARVVRDLMRICFLVEDTYAPYPKWFERAFVQLRCASVVLPLANQVVAASDWNKRDHALADLFACVCELFAQSPLAPSALPSVHPFHDRPLSVCVADSGVVRALLCQITDPALVSLVNKRPVGNIEMISDSVDVLENHSLRNGLRSLYESTD